MIIFSVSSSQRKVISLYTSPIVQTIQMHWNLYSLTNRTLLYVNHYINISNLMLYLNGISMHSYLGCDVFFVPARSVLSLLNTLKSSPAPQRSVLTFKQWVSYYKAPSESRMSWFSAFGGRSLCLTPFHRVKLFTHITNISAPLGDLQKES